MKIFTRKPKAILHETVKLFFTVIMIIFCGQIWAQAPRAGNDEIYTWDNLELSGNLYDNDTLVGINTYSILVETTLGDLTLDSEGNWTFNPIPGIAGVNEQIYYTVCNQSSQCDTAMIWVYVQFHNDLPEPENDYLFVERNEPRFGDASANDFEPDYLSDPISGENDYEYSTLPAHGDLVMLLDGTFQYTPDPWYTGSDQFNYIVCDPCGACALATVYITVLGNNEEPVATNSSVLNGLEDTPYNGNVSGLASDPENDPLTFGIAGNPAHGLVVMNSNGTFTYSPDEDYFGSDSFIYLVCDIVGQCVVGVVYLNIANANDPPIATNLNFTISEDSGIYSGNADDGIVDENPSTVTFSLLSQASHGTVVFSADGNYTYSPALNYSGADSFILQACDEFSLCVQLTIFVTVTSINDSPVAVNDDNWGYEDNTINGSVANDSDADGDLLTYSLIGGASFGDITINSNGSYSYLADPNEWGFETITYQVCDPSNSCDTGELTLEIVEINDDPIIISDSYSGNEDTTISGDIRDNDSEPDGEIIFYFAMNSPLHGELILNEDGTFTYQPDPNWSGTETISYYGCDPCSVCVAGTLTIVVNSVNDIPVATPYSFNVNEDAVYNNNISSNATDVESVSLTWSVSVTTQHGSLTISPAGILSYTPEPNYFGSDNATYLVCDGNGGCVTSTITITINSVNDSPVANDDDETSLEDQQVNGTVANDSDIDDVVLSYEIISDPMHGSIDLNSNGSFTYTPHPHYNGTDMITYEVCDDENACDAGVLVFYIDPVNDAPIANDDLNVTYENDLLTGSVATNDEEVDGEAMTFTVITTAQHGSFVMTADGSYTYTPTLNYSGSDQVVYSVCDPLLTCSVATLDITVFSTNTPPDASNINYSTNEDVVLSGNLNTGVTDLEGGVMSFIITVQPTHGTVNLSPGGSFTYTPEANYHGPDQFSWQVCDTGADCDNGVSFINVQSVNDLPLVQDDGVSLTEDGTVGGNVATNDSDTDGDPITFSVVTGPTSGAFNLAANGTFSYTPALNYFGTQIITYAACDPQGCSNGLLTITISPVNDPPVILGESYSIGEDNDLNGNVSTNDTDVDDVVLNYTLVSGVSHGSLLLDLSGSFSYNPDGGYYGSDSFTYLACDAGNACVEGVVSILVGSVNDLPIIQDDFFTMEEDGSISGDLLLNDSDADGDELSYSVLTGALNGSLMVSSDGTFNYTPEADFFGQENIVVNVCDGFVGGCVTSELFIMVTPINDLPVVVGESFTINEDSDLSGDVGVNDFDIESTILDYNIITDAVHGEFDLNDEGEFSYVPDPNYNGTESITYVVCDDDNGCIEGQLIINVTSINDEPVIVGEYKHVLEDSTGNGDLSLNDFDADGDDLIYSIVIDATHGEFELNPNGSYQFTPTPDFSGMDSLTYMACDPYNACFTAIIYLEVDFGNDAPIAVDESIQVVQDNLYSGSVGINDIEIDFEELHYFVNVNNSGGNFDMLDDGTFTYLPNDGVTGIFYVTYYACDPCAVCDEGMITIYVVPQGEENTPPTALNTSVDVCLGNSVVIAMNDLVSDIQDLDSQLEFTFGQPAHGAIVFDQSTHELQYLADTDNTSDFVIDYEVCDNGLVTMCSSGEIMVDVTPVVSPQLIEEIITSVNCYGESNGAINLVPAINQGILTYDWEHGPITEDLSNLSAGDYTVTITSDNECTEPSIEVITITQPQELAGSIVATNINDEGNGTIDLTITGGTGPYSVSWTGPNEFTSIQEDLTNLTEVGNYEAAITDDHGCVAHVSMNITGLAELEVTDFIVSPNPFLDEFVVNTVGHSDRLQSYQLFDAGGRLVMSNENINTTERIVIHAGSLPAGCYQLKLITEKSVQTISLIHQ